MTLTGAVPLEAAISLDNLRAGREEWCVWPPHSSPPLFVLPVQAPPIHQPLWPLDALRDPGPWMLPRFNVQDPVRNALELILAHLQDNGQSLRQAGCRRRLVPRTRSPALAAAGSPLIPRRRLLLRSWTMSTLSLPIFSFSIYFSSPIFPLLFLPRSSCSSFLCS